MGLLDSVIGRAVRFGQGVAARFFPGGSSMHSPRQERLEELDNLYQGRQYDNAGLAPSWDKQRHGAPRVPLRQQKPSVQYDLPRVIVDRPTSMLFGENGFPEISFEPQGDVDAEDVNSWFGGIVEEGGLRPTALTWARQGGTLGAAVLTWCVVDGIFDFEPHKSIHCTPTFHPRARRRLVKLEKRYKFHKEIHEVANGRLVVKQVPHWHREEWDEHTHTVYVDVPVGDGKEPAWVVDEQVTHGFGFVPAVWCKNIDDGEPGTVDGLSLLQGLSDIIEDCDRTLTGKSRAVRYNTEPEKIYSGLPMDPDTNRPLAVGGGASTSLPVGAKAELLELKGESIKFAEEHVVSQRARALEVSRVVMPDVEKLLASTRSGAALRILFAPTLELVGELRQSYGRALQEVFGQILRAARAGKLGTLETPAPPQLPPGKVCLVWGDYFEPTPDDIDAISRAAVALKQGGVLSHETIVRYLAAYFGVRDVGAEVDQVEKTEAKEYGDTGNVRTPPKPPPEEDPPQPEE